ncbi:helix-turn-helix domain-containing protein [Streptomyces sp. NBC_01429]|uniref:helix-turn-helix domain-containing protein n=1 Tax=Streptomyces sp. NBC_01429 TaxID=2903862 RepID=UPI002E2CF93A|nr:helix-turn-helix transcriptional regulator [Streptomyces sp. NBC_01429]
MSEATGGMATDGFAALLRELKDRSGLSYGALAKRLHMSTSTLHRYCNGTALPGEYAPAERLARVCRATPQELVELHRRWILADAARRTRPDQAAAEQGAAPAPSPAAATDAVTDAAPAPDSAVAASTHEEDEGDEADGNDEPIVVDVPHEPAPPRRRRNALVASVAVAAVLGAVVLAVNLPFGGGGGGSGSDATDPRAAGATGTADAGEPSAKDTAAPSPSPSPSGKSPGPSVSPVESGRVEPSASQGGGKRSAAGPTDGSGAEPGSGGVAVPLNVATRPYVYDNPCSQHFLVDSEPEQVGPPANEQDAPRWAAAYGAVSSGEQRVALTVQGAGRDTVVLQALHVRVVAKGAPLAWNDYEMGNGCGGGVDTKSFDIDLDNGSPTVTVKNGQRDFPYKVSESDPEVFYVTAHVKAHDVRWDLSLDWTSGSRHGTVQINNAGTPFRTSARVGRPEYVYPLGGSEWIKPGN